VLGIDFTVGWKTQTVGREFDLFSQVTICQGIVECSWVCIG